MEVHWGSLKQKIRNQEAFEKVTVLKICGIQQRLKNIAIVESPLAKKVTCLNALVCSHLFFIDENSLFHNKVLQITLFLTSLNV